MIVTLTEIRLRSLINGIKNFYQFPKLVTLLI